MSTRPPCLGKSIWKSLVTCRKTDYIMNEGRKEESKEGRKQGRKEGRKEEMWSEVIRIWQSLESFLCPLLA